jgi:anti-sigma regulatory factor (Ser/Thr protein kinase)
MALKSGRWELPPDPHHIGAVRREVASFAAHAGMPAPARTDLQVAVSDAITNAVIRAEGDPENGPVQVDALQLDDEIVVCVRDGGRARASQRLNCPAVGPRLSMIAALTEVFKVRRCESGATELSMHFALGRG